MLEHDLRRPMSMLVKGVIY